MGAGATEASEAQAVLRPSIPTVSFHRFKRESIKFLEFTLEAEMRALPRAGYLWLAGPVRDPSGETGLACHPAAIGS